MGSMFKNPEGDHSARLIEAAGLKGTRIGGAHISDKHANFFINDENATASDLWSLVQLARTRVAEAFGITLEMEVELVGDFSIRANREKCRKSINRKLTRPHCKYLRRIMRTNDRN